MSEEKKLRESEHWFIEQFQNEGTLFGLEITEKLHEEQSDWQKLEIYQTRTFGKLMVIDGCIMLTERDNFLYHEMMTHPALYTHPNPERVAIIGGGDCGTLKEVLKHPSIKQVTQIDIDERVTRLSEKYFPELCSENGDPRAALKFIDGIKWMADAEAASLDIVIVDSTDPVGPAEGLFSEAFYRTCFNALGEHGLLVQQSESPLLHAGNLIKDIHAAMRGAGFSASKTLPFPQPVYPSGWWSATLASKSVSIDQFREQDAQAKAFQTEYYNAETHRAALAQPEFMKNALR